MGRVTAGDRSRHNGGKMATRPQPPPPMETAATSDFPQPPRPPQPLAGLRVVEFTHMVMGPTCGMVLADMGAEVLKVEPIDGDRTRRLLGAGAGFFPMFNRNKKSIAIDLHHPSGAEVARNLAASVARGCRLRRSGNPKTCSMIRICSRPAGWRISACPTAHAPANRCRRHCSRSRWTGTASACAWTLRRWVRTPTRCWPASASRRRRSRRCASRPW